MGRIDTLGQVDARYPAILFKQQLTACVEKIFGQLRDNLKKEISPLLSVCIQVLIHFKIWTTNRYIGNLDMSVHRLPSEYFHAGSKIITCTAWKSIQTTWGWCPTTIKLPLGQYCQFSGLAYVHVACKLCEHFLKLFFFISGFKGSWGESFFFIIIFFCCRCHHSLYVNLSLSYSLL